METYRIISRCLMGGLNDVGIQCVSCDSTNALRETKREMKLPCFLAPNRNEIMVDGKKLVGSAQKRTAEAILQHGSIPLTSAYRNLPDYLKLSGKLSVQPSKKIIGRRKHLYKRNKPQSFRSGNRQRA